MNDFSLFNSLFDDFGNGILPVRSMNYKKVFQTPKVDVKENADSYTLEMDLPGKTEKDVNIELHKNVLTISSEKQEEKLENENKDKTETKQEDSCEKWLIRERSFLDFSRSFTLPDDVDSEKLSANVKNGVLTVFMPRKAISSPRKIAITCA